MKRTGYGVWAVLAVLACVAPARAYVAVGPPPLRAWARADVIVYARVIARPDGGPMTRLRTLTVLEVLKGKPALGRQRTLTVDCGRALGDHEHNVILFCKREKTLSYVGHFLPTSLDTLGYVKGLGSVPEGSSVHTAAFFLRHADHADFTVAAAVYHELSTADSKHVIEAARKAPPDTLARALKARSGDLSAFLRPRHDLYGLLLGHCGTAEHIDPLRQAVEEVSARGTSVKGLLQGLILIRPADGLAVLKTVLHASTRPLETRSTAVQALEFFIERRPDLLPQTDLVQALVPALAQPDLADRAVEYLRAWRRWELTRAVLRLWQTAAEAPTLRRSVLRFALSSPHPEAAPFLQRARREAPEEVAAVEQEWQATEARRAAGAQQ
jgi:hypothetical protein